MFDQFVFVDWSANSKPKTGKDSIWIADAVGTSAISVHNPATRDEATDYVLALLRQAVTEKRRVLVGFDFAYSYPLSVLHRIAARQGPRDFSSLWRTLHERIQDHSDNSNDRYSFAAWANEYWFEHHYFWGFPSAPQATSTWLESTKRKSGLPEFRLAELQARGTQPIRKLAYPGSVGSQALLGMRRLHAIRNHPTLVEHSCVWPMETGFSLPSLEQGAPLIVHAEIYPTPAPRLVKEAGIAIPATVADMVNDARQVWSCAALARHEDSNGLLANRFKQPSALNEVETEQAQREGWILWT